MGKAIWRTFVRSLIILLVAAVFSVGIYALSKSPWVPALTVAMNVPRDRNVGLLAGPLSALNLLPYSSPTLPIFDGIRRGANNYYLIAGLTDVAKNLFALGFFIGVVALIQAIIRRRALHSAQRNARSAIPNSVKRK